MMTATGSIEGAGLAAAAADRRAIGARNENLRSHGADEEAGLRRASAMGRAFAAAMTSGPWC